MSKRYCVFYGTEENGYEEEKLGEFNTLEEAKRCVAENLADDFDTAEEVADAVSDIDDEGFEGENGAGYHILYLIGETEAQCLCILYGLREEFLEEFEGEEE